jgi:two-component system sensor histidine kinase/response regulator
MIRANSPIMAQQRRRVLIVDAHAAEVGEAKLELVDIDALFAQAAAAAAAVAAEKRIRIVCEPSWLRAPAEPSMLSHALENLISNAIKYSPLGSAVRLKAVARGAGVRIYVSDRGPGIPPEEAALLFGKFARLSALPTAAEPSSGLGLDTVRILAERMGAAAGWEPNPEGGSVFFSICRRRPKGAARSLRPSEQRRRDVS